MHKVTASLALIVFAGCAELPTSEVANAADYGREPTQSECENFAKSYLLSQLRDPQSAQFRFGKCEKHVFNSIPIFGLPIRYGYAIPVEVNAKNGFGGYVGFTPYLIGMKDGLLVET